MSFLCSLLHYYAILSLFTSRNSRRHFALKRIAYCYVRNNTQRYDILPSARTLIEYCDEEEKGKNLNSFIMLAVPGHFKAAVVRKYEDVDNTGTPEINCIRCVKRCTKLCTIKNLRKVLNIYLRKGRTTFSVS